MKVFKKKKIVLGIILLLVVIVAYFSLSNAYLLRQGPIGAGIKAHLLCSGIFVSGREPESVLLEDIAFHPLFDLLKTKIDYDNRSVTASLFGLVKKKAVFRDGFGATLLSGSPIEEFLAPSLHLPVPEPKNPESVPWPSGDSLSTDGIPPNIDTQKLHHALNRAFKEADPERLKRTRAVVVVYDGKLVAERYARGIKKDTPLIGWSMTKSVTNALVGIMIKEKKLTLEDPVNVPEWNRNDDLRSRITLDQLLRMSSGLKFIEEYEENPISDVNLMLFTKPDMAAFAASMPLEAEPDTRWSYSSGTTNIIQRIVRQAFDTHENYVSFPRRSLFNRLGMRSAVLEMDSSGTFIGSSFMFASARDWARIGLLYLQDGIWAGERILPEGWVAYSTTPTPLAPIGEYGAHFWLNRGRPGNPGDRLFPKLPEDAFFMLGYQEQNVVIIPSRSLVVVRLGMTYSSEAWDLQGFVADVLEAIGEGYDYKNFQTE